MILTCVSAIVAFVLSLLFGVVYIDFVKKKTFKQYIREEGPKSHQAKSGTPTTGGVFIILASVIAALIGLFMEQVSSTTAILIIMTYIFYMLAGFRDDYNKIKNHQNLGLTPRGKLFLQFAIAILPALYVTLNGQTTVNVFGFSLQLGYFYPLFAMFLITGVSNAVNLTDGLDGLAASNMVFALLGCTLICLFTEQIDLAIISASIMGACLGFLFYNKKPAQIFMGDTGSLALGGVLGTLAVIGKFEFWLILIGIIFLIETLSVMLQVTSYKLTGKRIFKMSPIHHHFELSGWSENKIVVIFSLITLIFSIFAVILYIYI